MLIGISTPPRVGSFASPTGGQHEGGGRTRVPRQRSTKTRVQLARTRVPAERQLGSRVQYVTHAFFCIVVSHRTRPAMIPQSLRLQGERPTVGNALVPREPRASRGQEFKRNTLPFSSCWRLWVS